MESLGKYDQLIRRAAIVVAIVALFLTFWLALGSKFHADDFRLGDRVEKPFVESAVHYLSHPDPEAVYQFRPIARIVQHAILATVGLSAPTFHSLNLLLHLLISFLLYQLVRRLTGEQGIAFWSALIFAVHPAHAEPVIWVTGMSMLGDSVCHLAGLIALHSYIENRKTSSAMLVVLSFILATLFKESGVTFVLTGGLLVLWKGRSWRDWRPLVACLGWLVVFAIWRMAAGVQTSQNWESLTFNPVGPIRNLLYYLTQFLLPVRSLFRIWDFDAYYRLRDALPSVPDTVIYVAAVLALAGCVAFFIWRHWSKIPHVTTWSAALAVASFLPLLFSIHTGMRLLYLASAWMSVALATLVYSARRHRWPKWVLYAWILMMSASLVERATAWNQAGELADRVLTEAVRTVESNPTVKSFVFLDVPGRLNGAFVLPAFFAEAVAIQTERPTSDFRDFGDPATSDLPIPEDASWYRWTGHDFRKAPMQRPPE